VTVSVAVNGSMSSMKRLQHDKKVYCVKSSRKKRPSSCCRNGKSPAVFI